MSNISEIIKTIRKSKDSIIQLAKKMRMSQAYIAKLEMGEIKPMQEQIETIKAFISGRL